LQIRSDDFLDIVQIFRIQQTVASCLEQMLNRISIGTAIRREIVLHIAGCRSI
jgi:hypothetical protein